ncbi:retrovirus-related pol polyprotein from transposon TNT 1-94 [Tanacetum coccineum]
MSEEMQSFQKNQTWELTNLPEGKKLDLELVQMDVKTAFLHGDLEEEIYMVQPEGFKVARKEHEVYDMLIASQSSDEIKKIKTWLKSEFEMKDLGEAKMILGMEIISDVMSPKNDAERAYMEKVPYANAAGSLMYAMIYLDKRRSTTGYVFTLAKAPINWKSTLQSTTALSTTEAEYMAMTEASAIHLAKNQVYHARTKHIDVRYHFIREILEEGEFRIQKIHTSKNPADMLTKVVAGIKFNYCLDLINVVKS